ncbi:MAG: hypothetical protein AB1345_08290 [Chloroflexota bacterium]
MSVGKKILNVVSWIITIPVQGGLGIFLGFIASVLGRITWILSLTLMWLGITIGLYAIGALSLALRKGIRHKKYLVRISSTGLGVLIPMALLLVLALKLGYDSAVISDRWGPLLSFFAIVLGLLGFYLPGWFGSKSNAY